MRRIQGPFTVEGYRARRAEIEREVAALPHWALNKWEPYYYVYRYYNDDAPIGHRLHYIGMTRDFIQRDSFHSWKSPWRMALPITRIEIVEYPDKWAAEEAERLAIRFEIPCHNGIHNDRWRANHPEGWLTPACDPEYLRTGKTDGERRREAMDKLGEVLDLSSLPFTAS